MINVNVGDVVQLKSGGPLMTVSKIEDDRLDCAWFGPGDTYMIRMLNAQTVSKVGSDQAARC